MISLPPGCTANYPITIHVNSVTTDMAEWFTMQGGHTEVKKRGDYRGSTKESIYVRYGDAKWCHYMNDGTSRVRLQFNGTDIDVAMMFLLKFNDQITDHNLQQQQELYEKSLL